jgi:hypothetical protein
LELGLLLQLSHALSRLSAFLLSGPLHFFGLASQSLLPCLAAILWLLRPALPPLPACLGAGALDESPHRPENRHHHDEQDINPFIHVRSPLREHSKLCK